MTNRDILLKLTPQNQIISQNILEDSSTYRVTKKQNPQIFQYNLQLFLLFSLGFSSRFSAWNIAITFFPPCVSQPKRRHFADNSYKKVQEKFGEKVFVNHAPSKSRIFD